MGVGPNERGTPIFSADRLRIFSDGLNGWSVVSEIWCQTSFRVIFHNDS
jgi:hypothetical protein